MAWYYVLNGATHGPVAEADVRNLREQHVVGLDTPVWSDGMAEWIPFERSPLAGGDGIVAAAGATHACAECGKSFPQEEMLQYENVWVCAACKPVFFQKIKEGVPMKGHFNFASVGRRFGAVFIDGLIFGVPVMVISIVMAASTQAGQKPDNSPLSLILVMLLGYLAPPIYEIIMVKKYGATLGKMAMKIKVIRRDGTPMSYGRSTGRYFAKLLSGIILYIGYLMAFWDEEKCALHDRICQTRVVSVDPS